MIEHDFDLPSLPEPVLTDKDAKIGQTIAELIQNGDTVQIGFGSMPNAVMEYLKGHRDLGIYTEMLPDKVVDLYEKGVITNDRIKKFIKEKQPQHLHLVPENCTILCTIIRIF